MSTLYQYNKKEHGKGNMIAYAKIMEQFNLSDAALKEFASALKAGDLDAIKTLFANLSIDQKSGLLKLYIDYNDIENTWSHAQPQGFVFNLANQFNHLDVIDYLTSCKNELASLDVKKPHLFTRGSTARFFTPQKGRENLDGVIKKADTPQCR